MNEIIEEKLAEIEKARRSLSISEEAKHTSKTTLARGRLIRELKSLRNLLLKEKNLTEKGQKLLDQINLSLSQELFEHKIQLNERYSKEFVHGEAKVPDLVTTLPKGLALQTKKIANTINQIKTANTTKAKFSGLAEFGKDLGLLVATPVIFAGKFVIEHWYLLLLWWGAKKAQDHLRNSKDKSQPQEQPQEVPAEEPATEPVVEPVGDEVKEQVPGEVPGEVPVPNGGYEPGMEPAQVPISFYNQFGWDVVNSSLLDEFIKMLRDSGVLGNATVYKTAEEAVKHIPQLCGLPMDIALDSLPSFAQNLNITWVIGRGGLFATEEAFIQAMSFNYQSCADFFTANPLVAEKIQRAASTGTMNPKDLFSGINLNSIGNALGVTGEVAGGLLVLYLAVKLGLAIPTYGASLAF